MLITVKLSDGIPEGLLHFPLYFCLKSHHSQGRRGEGEGGTDKTKYEKGTKENIKNIQN